MRMNRIFANNLSQKRFFRLFFILLFLGIFSIPIMSNQGIHSEKRQTEVVFEIPSSSDPNAFLSVWNTSKSGVSASNQVQLPLLALGTYNFVVDWGDGSPTDSITAWNSPLALHTYTASGQYMINITGTIIGWKFAGVDDRLKLMEILQWGCLRLGDFNAYFAGCKNLELTATDALDLTGTTSLRQAFWQCTNLGDVGDMSLWDVSGVTDMYMMFYNATSFNQSIGDWDVSSVTEMSNMFYWASSFNQPIDNWDVGNVLSMQSMFREASSFNQPIGNWNVSNVADLQFMFADATLFNQPIGGWNLSDAVNMQYLFYEATSFNQPLNDWDITGVIDLTQMFYRADSFNQPLDKWDVSGIMDMEWLFAQAHSFNQSLESWDVSNVTDMHNMFYQADSFNQIIGTWDVSNVTHMEYMFYGADSFNQFLNNWDVSSVTDMNHMFYYAEEFNQPLNSWDVSNVQDMSSMFNLALNFNQSLNSWDVSAVIDMNYMFRRADAFNQPLDNWIVSSVTNMDYMFHQTHVFNQPLGDWDVSNVSSMEFMLYSNALTKVNYDNLLLGWSTESLQPGVNFYAGNTKYSSLAVSARQSIIDTYGWTITDGGLDSLPDLFILTSDADSPDTDGNFLLSWTPSYAASNYSVYQHTGYITEVNATLLSLASQISDLSLPITGYDTDTYYFIVVANNEYGAELSNCIQVIVNYTNNLNITYPDSTARLLQGKSIFIRWTSSGEIAFVKLELYRDNAFVMEIIANVSNTGMYGWLVPADLSESMEYRIKISDVINPETYSYSEYFEIYSNKIPGFNIFLIIGIIGLIGGLLVRKNIEKK